MREFASIFAGFSTRYHARVRVELACVAHKTPRRERLGAQQCSQVLRIQLAGPVTFSTRINPGIHLGPRVAFGSAKALEHFDQGAQAESIGARAREGGRTGWPNFRPFVRFFVTCNPL